MKLTIVGCSGSFPGPDSAASCYLLQAPWDGGTYALVVDLGNGALGALQRHVDLVDVGAVALSHLHADHCLDLAPYHVVRRFHPRGPLPVLRVVGPAGTASRVAHAAGVDERAEGKTVFDFATWQAGVPVALGPFMVTPARVTHPVETYALRIEHDGKVLVYSGDTAPSSALVELARDADLLLCEASFVEGADNPPDIHLTGHEAGQHAHRADVGLLVLTHVPPWHDTQQALAEAALGYAGPIELAHPGAVYTV